MHRVSTGVGGGEWAGWSGVGAAAGPRARDVAGERVSAWCVSPWYRGGGGGTCTMHVFKT